MVDDLSDAISRNAQGPAQASSDGLAVRQHDLSEQIAADRYLASRRARRNPVGALVIYQIVPPGGG